MKKLRRFLKRLTSWSRTGRDEDRLRAEIEEHLAFQTEDNLRAGLSPEAARRQAMLKFGAIEAIKEDCRSERRLPFLASLLRDARHELRQVRKAPVFAITAIVTLAIGIGATTAVFSVASAVIFASLPFPRPDRLVLLFESDIGQRFQPGVENISAVRNGIYQDWREQARSFQRIAAAERTQATLMEGGRASVIDGLLVDDGFFETIGVGARLGRPLMATDYAGGGSRVVVLADRLWRERYGAEATVLGREIVLDGADYQVVGVMPPGFWPADRGSDPQYWSPLHWDPGAEHRYDLWGNTGLGGNWVYARLNGGVTLAQAQSEMDTITARQRAAHPVDDSAGAIVAPFDGYLFGHQERLFVLLLAAVGLVLLIACANVANLLLTRALERQREFALRSALGASRAAILQQVLAESLVLAGAGGVLGVALSPLLARPALALLPAISEIPRLDQVHVDWRVLLFTLLISILAGLVFGVAPAIRAARGDLSLALRSGGRGMSLGRGEGRLSDMLVIAEVAFSLVLLAGGVLLTRAFLKLLHTNPGFRPEQSVAVRLAVPKNRYGKYELGGSNAPRRLLYDRLERSARSIPNVQVAALTATLPLRQWWNPWDISIEGRPPAPGPDGRPMINQRWGLALQGEASSQTVSPGYFAALGIPLIHGRTFNDGDRPEAPLVTVINQAAARKFFPNQDPVGERIAIDMTSYAPRMTIIGVVGDARMDGMDEDPRPEVFWAAAQIPPQDAWLIVRTRGDAGAVAHALGRAIHDVDPEIAMVEAITMASAVSDSLWRERFSALLVGLFAVLAVLIAAGGLYAVISHAVERRTQELGVRLALGATSAQIARMVLGHGLRIVATGIIAGTPFIVAGRRFLTQQSQQAGETSSIYVAVAVFLLVLALLASWVPLRRALAVDPATVLRSE